MGRGLSLKLLFAGTSEFAVPALQALAGGGAAPLAVITRPPRPAGRGQRDRLSPVHFAALDLGLAVRTPGRINDAEELQALAALKPDLLVVAAYGQILKQELLGLPRLGCLNLHASLLPAWRGAAPVAHALLAGERETGVTLMQMDAGLDTGPMLARRRTPIVAADDRGRLTLRLSHLAAGLLLDSLPQLLCGRLRPTPQDGAAATLAPPLKKADGYLDWSRPAAEVARRVRAYSPRPGAFTFLAGRRLLIRAARPLPPSAEPPHGPPGCMGEPRRDGVPVRCGGDSVLTLLTVQPEGRAVMAAAAAARGRHLPAGACLGRLPD